MYKQLLIWSLLMLVGLPFCQAQDTLSLITQNKSTSGALYNRNPNTGIYQRDLYQKSGGFVKKYFYIVGSEGKPQKIAYGNRFKKVVIDNQKAVNQVNWYQAEMIAEMGTMLGAVGGVIFIPLHVLNSDNPQPVKFALIAFGLGCMSRTLHLIKGRHLKKAVVFYNEDLLQPEDTPKVGLKLNFKVESMEASMIPGIGLGLRF